MAKYATYYLFINKGLVMAAQIKRLQPTDKQSKQKQIEQLQAMLDLFPEINENKTASLLWEIKRKNKLNNYNTWTFIMISPEQNNAVVQWLATNSKRRIEAMQLWSMLFEYVHQETGQIMLSRQEIANKINISLNDTSRIMSELESINAILKKKEGRGVIYYMNPNVANHYPQKIREKAQKVAPSLKIFNGGKA